MTRLTNFKVTLNDEIPTMKILTKLQDHPIYHFEKTVSDTERVCFIADADIDCDGSGGNPDGDKYFQPDTSLHREGKALNAYKEAFIVVPPIIIRQTVGAVLGCQARVHYLRTGLIIDAVVGDIGPTKKVGELSCLAAKKLGMNPSPVNGGEDDLDMVVYELWPGIPAIVDGIHYELKHS